MATSPVVIPYAQTLLAYGVLLNANSVVAQPVLTVPNGMRVVVSQIVFRDPSFTYTATGAGTAFTALCSFATAGALPVLNYLTASTFSIASNGTATIASATAGSGVVPGAAAYVYPVVSVSIAGTATVAVPIAQMGDVLNVTLSYGTGTVPAAGSALKCDVLGFLEAY